MEKTGEQSQHMIVRTASIVFIDVRLEKHILLEVLYSE
jgi:hypothetical protein